MCPKLFMKKFEVTNGALYIQCDFKLLLRFRNFQIGNNKIKLLTEYESVTKKVLFGSTVLLH
jgi:hypothetical protein